MSNKKQSVKKEWNAAFGQLTASQLQVVNAVESMRNCVFSGGFFFCFFFRIWLINSVSLRVRRGKIEKVCNDHVRLEQNILKICQS